MAIRIDDVDLNRDRALVQRFQAGDGAAFDELYGRYRHRLERFCLKRLGDHHAAEEVAQEAFTRALAALPEFGGERRFYPWVSVIASRLCVDHHRRQARSELTSEVHCPAVPGGQDDIVDAVDAELVTTALARLGPRHQDVLRLREVEGWSYRRIADHYEVPLSTIETLLFRARRALRREFDIIDGAGLAAVPFLGWLMHGIGRARDRLAPMASLNPAQSGFAAAATATVAAVAIAIVPASQPPTPPLTRNHVTAPPAATGPALNKPASSKPAPPAPPPLTPAPAAPATTVVTATAFALSPGPGAASHTPVPSVVVAGPPSVVPTTLPAPPALTPGGLPSVTPATPPITLPVPLTVPGLGSLPLPGVGQLPAGLPPNGLLPKVPGALGPLSGNLKL